MKVWLGLALSALAIGWATTLILAVPAAAKPECEPDALSTLCESHGHGAPNAAGVNDDIEEVATPPALGGEPGNMNGPYGPAGNTPPVGR